MVQLSRSKQDHSASKLLLQERISNHWVCLSRLFHRRLTELSFGELGGHYPLIGVHTCQTDQLNDGIVIQTDIIFDDKTPLVWLLLLDIDSGVPQNS